MPQTDPQTQMVADRYRLEREIGRGGMGAVWLGHDELLGRRVALKRVGVHPGAHEADLERVRREARVSAMLNHEHVVAVYDLVAHAGQHWLVMEYVESQNFAAYIKEHGPLSPDETARLIRQATVALAAAHGAGIIHRDVKPSNLLVTSEGQVKLTDFGIARTGADSSLTQTGMVTGSPGYLAPEVASGRPATAASDMWSLGATIFHAVTGRPPYDASDNLIGTLYQIVHEEPVRTDRSGWLDPVLRATMDRAPEGRWTARQVTDFLTRGPQSANGFPAPVPSTSPVTTAERPPVIATPGSSAPSDATEVLPVTSRSDHGVGIPTATGAAAVGTPGIAPTGEHDGPEGGGRGNDGAGTVGRGAGGAGGAGTGSTKADADRASGGNRLVPILVGLLVAAIVIMGVVAWQLINGDDTSGDNRAQDSTSQTASTPDESNSAKTSKQDKPTKVEMTDFVANYVSTAAGDPAAGFAQLTPAFQQQSNGLQGYRGWWGQFSDATASKIKADTKNMTVSYDVNYVYKDGRTLSDSVSLRLEYADGVYKIAGEG